MPTFQRGTTSTKIGAIQILRLCPPRARARARQKREPKRWERHVNECNAQNVTTTYHRSERQGCLCTSSPSCSLIRKENVTTSIFVKTDVPLCRHVFLELFVPEEKVNDGLRFLGSLFSLSKCGVKMNFCVRKIVEKWNEKTSKIWLIGKNGSNKKYSHFYFWPTYT